jgi:hypothetical protein
MTTPAWLVLLLAALAVAVGAVGLCLQRRAAARGSSAATTLAVVAIVPAGPSLHGCRPCKKPSAPTCSQARTASQADVPHISQCSTCDDCIVDTASEPNQRYLLLPEEQPDEDGRSKRGPYVKFAGDRVPIPQQCMWDPASIRLGPNAYNDTPAGPPQQRCAKCRGCTAKLTNISAQLKVVAGVSFFSGIGGTDNWLFYGQKHGSQQQ